MTTPSNVLKFYAEAHWGSRYGVIDAAHPTHHKGLDCGLFHGEIDVPALHPGLVVAVGPSSSVGHYVTVKRGDGKFDTYCHIVPGVTNGERVIQGQRLGRQAETKAEGGTAWLGQHTHLTLSDTIDGWSSWGKHNLDPTPGVVAILTATAGGGSQPLPEGAEVPSLIRIIFDQGADLKDGLFASTAIYNETTGWVQTSAGYGPRDDLAMYSAIAGALGFNVTEVHVNHDGWLMAQHFVPPKGGAAVPDLAAIIKGVSDGIGKDLADLTADELAKRLVS